MLKTTHQNDKKNITEKKSHHLLCHSSDLRVANQDNWGLTVEGFEIKNTTYKRSIIYI